MVVAEEEIGGIEEDKNEGWGRRGGRREERKGRGGVRGVGRGS